MSSVSPVSPCIQRQSRVARRIHEQMDSAEESRNSTYLPEKSANLSESTASVKAKRRQGVSDSHIPPLALFSLGTLGSDHRRRRLRSMQPHALSARLCLLPQAGRRSHLTYGNSSSYRRARIATSDAHARPRSSSTSTFSSSSYSTFSTTGQAAPSSVWFPSSYTAPGAASSSRSRSPSIPRPRTGLVPNFSRPTSLGLGLLIPLSAAAAVPVSHQSACLAPRELEHDYTAEYDPVSGYASGLVARRRSGERDGEEDCADAGDDGHVDLADFDFAADYAAYAPLLRTPTPSPGVGMGYGISIGATASWGAHVHGDDEDEWVAYTEEAGYIKDGGDEEQQQELSPLVAPAPSPAPLSESELEYSPDEDDNEDKQE